MNANGYSGTDEGGALWSSVLASLRGKLSARRLEEVECSTDVLERTPSSLRIAGHREPLRAWVQDGRLSLLDAAVTSLTDGGAELAVLPVANDRTNGILDPTRTLASFIASSSNEPALACARALGSERSEQSGPIVLFGPPGSGKTHLVQGIAAALTSSSSNLICHNADRLSHALISALRQGELERFRAPLRACRTLLVDDVHLLAGREGTQEELAGVLAARTEAGRPTVLSTRLAPDQARDLRPELVAHMERGHSFTLSAPEWETRVAVILDRIGLWHVRSTPQVASLLAHSLGASLARLDAVLTRLMTHPACGSALQDTELVRRILENGGPLVSSARPQEVIQIVSQHFSVRPAELRSAARSPRITTPRQLAMYLMRHHCGLSYPEIGQRFRRHHTTAMHACKRIEEQRDSSSSMRAAVLVLEKELLRLSEDGG